MKNSEEEADASAKLEAAIREESAASKKLGARVFWLNVILAAATAVGAFAAA